MIVKKYWTEDSLSPVHSKMNWLAFQTGTENYRDKLEMVFPKSPNLIGIERVEKKACKKILFAISPSAEKGGAQKVFVLTVVKSIGENGITTINGQYALNAILGWNKKGISMTQQVKLTPVTVLIPTHLLKKDGGINIKLQKKEYILSSFQTILRFYLFLLLLADS